MTKHDAMWLLGHRFVADMAQDMGISNQTWHRLSDPLPDQRTNEVIGIATRRGTEIPARLLK